MAKQIIKLTEGDLHRIIEKTVRKIVKESDDDWKESYEKWKKSTDSEEGEKHNREFTRRLKKAYPDAGKRKHAFNQYAKSKDTSTSKEYEKKWKGSGGEEKFNKEYQKKYGKSVDSDSMDESIKRAVNESLNKLMTDKL